MKKMWKWQTHFGKKCYFKIQLNFICYHKTVSYKVFYWYSFIRRSFIYFFGFFSLSAYNYSYLRKLEFVFNPWSLLYMLQIVSRSGCYVNVYIDTMVVITSALLVYLLTLYLLSLQARLWTSCSFCYRLWQFIALIKYFVIVDFNLKYVSQFCYVIIKSDLNVTKMDRFYTIMPYDILNMSVNFVMWSLKLI